MEPVTKLETDVAKAAAELGVEEGRYLVDLYYELQEHRKALRNQERALSESGEPTALVSHFGTQIENLEKQLPKVLTNWADSFTVGTWAMAQRGIGGVLAAGLLAHIDITKANTAGSIWRFAGLDPSVTWNKGERRPWNATLKTHCWKIGDSFVKQSGYDDCYYGQLYRQRKAYELERDEQGGNEEAALAALENRNIKDADLKETYQSGHLPAGRLDLRARRWAVKMFLAHYHEVAYVAEYDELPPKPYPIAHLGHTHEIAPPHAPARVVELREEHNRNT